MTTSDPLDGKIREALADLGSRAPLAPDFQSLGSHLSTGRRPVLWAVAVVIVVIGLVASGALLTRNDGSDVATGPSDPTAPDQDGVASSCSERAASLVEPEANVVVFLAPDATTEDQAGIRSDLEQIQSVRILRFVDQDMTFAEFEELFADQPQLVENVAPDIMPTRFEVLVDAESPVETVADAVADAPGLREVLSVEDFIGETRRSCEEQSEQPGTTETSPIEGDTMWGGAILSADEMTLEISVGSQPPGDGPCEQRFVYELMESEESVTVTFVEVQTTPTAGLVPCPLMDAPQQFEIRLAAPLGDRDVFDGVQDQPRRIRRLADVVEPTVLPDGVTVGELSRSPDSRGEAAWTQSAQVPSGPGWDLWIDQVPAGSFIPPSTAPGEVIDVIEVHGKEARIYEYFNHTGHMIQWTEGGLDITVRAELHTVNMSEPLSFANPGVAFIDEVLVQVADGIVVGR